MLPEMVLFSLCHLVCQEHALFMFYHFQNDISKGTAFLPLLAWLEFVSKQVCCLVCVHFRQNIPFGQECLSFCLRSNASCSNCCFKEHYKKISLKGCQSSRFTQTRANTTTTKSTASRWIVWLFEKNKSKHCANFYFCNELKEAQCGNYGNSLLRIFDKNFVKVTVLLNKLLKNYFDEIFPWRVRVNFSFFHTGEGGHAT